MTSRTALICDDDKMIAMVAKMVLKQKGFEVLEASDGRAGTDLIKANRPGLVFLDLNMPDVDGRGVLRALSTDGYTGSYIVVLSGEDGSAVDEEVRGLGAHECMRKPFNPMALGKRIDELIRDGKV